MHSEKDSTIEQFSKSSGLSKQAILALSSRNQPRTRLSRAQNKSQGTNFNIDGHHQNLQIVKKQVKTIPIGKNFQQQQLVKPKTPQQFAQMYKKFLTSQCNQKLSQTFIQWIQNNKKCLYEMLCNSLKQEQEGGIIKIIAQGRLKTQFQKFIIALNATSTDQAFQKYKKHLLKYQFYLSNNSIKSKHKIQDLIHSATFVSESQLSQLLNVQPLSLKYYEEDILVLKNGEASLKINHQTISLDKVTQKYKDFVVDIRIQKPMDYGFNVNKLRNQPFQMKLSDYRKYQKICQDNPNTSFKQKHDLIKQLGSLQNIAVNGIKFSQRLKKGEIFFAVNFDPSDGLLIQHIQQHVKNTFIGYKQSFDLLSYLDHEVPGCSLPQFYFKVKGVWTGGHQENINMCAININHGPDSSEWYSMNYEHVQQFRRTLKQKFKIDLYSQQGLWYEKINWFLQNGFPIKKIIQKKGDVVVSGPGTLHWVRSYGIALQSAWNIFPTTYQQFKHALHRHAQNKRLKFVKSSTIPFKSLVLKYLNHEHGHMRQNVEQLLIQTVQGWYNQEEKLIKDIRQLYKVESHALYQKLQDLQSFCQICHQQVLMYFVDGIKSGIMCLQCYKDKQNDKMRKQNNQKIYIKNYPGSIHSLLGACKNQKQFTQFQEFCNAPHVGKNVRCRFRDQYCKQDYIKQNQSKIQNSKIQEILQSNMRARQECMQMQKQHIKQNQIRIIDKDQLIKGQKLLKGQKQQSNQEFKYHLIQQKIVLISPNQIEKSQNSDIPTTQNTKRLNCQQLNPKEQQVQQGLQLKTSYDFKRQRAYNIQQKSNRKSRSNSPQFSSSSQHEGQKNKKMPSSMDKVKKKYISERQYTDQKYLRARQHKKHNKNRSSSQSSKNSSSSSSQKSHRKKHKKQRKKQSKKYDVQRYHSRQNNNRQSDRGHDRDFNKRAENSHHMKEHNINGSGRDDYNKRKYYSRDGSYNRDQDQYHKRDSRHQKNNNYKNRGSHQQSRSNYYENYNNRFSKDYDNQYRIERGNNYRGNQKRSINDFCPQDRNEINYNRHNDKQNTYQRPHNEKKRDQFASNMHTNRQLNIQQQFDY